MNIIGIDPSINSTGMCINGKIFNFSNVNISYNKNGLSKWYKICESYIEIHDLNYKTKKGSYQETELLKLIEYDNTTDIICNIIISNIKNLKNSIIGIESYSYGSNYGDIIDLVTFSTLLRKKIKDKISDNIIIIPPSTLKLLSAKLTYPTIIENKKEKYKNYQGISGGNFTKREMFLSIIENVNIDDDYSNFLRSIEDDILSLSQIKKPIEDCNDSYLIYQILKNKLIF